MVKRGNRTPCLYAGADDRGWLDHFRNRLKSTGAGSMPTADRRPVAKLGLTGSNGFSISGPYLAETGFARSNVAEQVRDLL